MPKIIDLTGKKFGRLTVIEKSNERSSGSIKWICTCECGNTVSVVSRDLRNGHTKSCGCIPKGHKVEHGMSNTRIYNIWSHMRRRCKDKKREDYSRYGGKGITVCNEWESFSAFYEWAMANGYKDILTIDRIDNEKGYSPENCRWVDIYAQAQNRRCCLYYEKDGDIKTLAEWCRELELDYHLIYCRIRRGWSFDRAISEPIHIEKRNKIKESR